MQKDPITRRDRPNTCRKKGLNNLGKAIEAVFNIDKVQLGSIDVAISKARTALMFRRPTLFWEETVASGRQGYLSLNNMLPIEGGIPLQHNDEIVGAIGVSGVKSSEDGQIAKAGADAL